VLEREFDAGALSGLREAVLAYATAQGMPSDRAVDVMLAVHELAANSVRHGAGHGRVMMRVSDGTLRCEVSDPGPASRDGHSLDGAGPRASRAPGSAPWPLRQGHGLWLVSEAADQLAVSSGPEGSLITAVFALPAAEEPAPRRGSQAIPGSGG
jgi:anti-sigma regulatory factor (Ser/Thr protein kinase)